MTTPRRRTAAKAVGVALLGGLAASTLTTSVGAPNPYGDGSVSTEVRIASDGSYDVTLTVQQELVLDGDLIIGGRVHDGFRLPDDGSPVPPYLRVDYRPGTATVDGVATQPDVGVEHHSVEMRHEVRGEPGDHTLTLDYQVSGAALASDDDVAVYVAPLGYAGLGRVEILAEDEIVGVECIAVPPASVPCGEPSADGSWLVEAEWPDENGSGQLRVLLDADPSNLVEPRVDRG